MICEANQCTGFYMITASVMKGINLLSVNYSGQYYKKNDIRVLFFIMSSLTTLLLQNFTTQSCSDTICYIIFNLDGNFTDLPEELSNTCNDGEYNGAVGGSNNFTAGKVEEKRQRKHRPCLGLDGTIYYPDEFEIVYRNCTLKEFCPSFPPRKKTKLTEILKLHKKTYFWQFF